MLLPVSRGLCPQWEGGWRSGSTPASDCWRYVNLLFLSLHSRTYLEFIVARKGKGTGPPLHPHGEDIIDSDDELIGAFNEDEDEVQPNESSSEEDDDQDIVVSTLYYARNTKPTHSTDSPMDHR